MLDHQHGNLDPGETQRLQKPAAGERVRGGGGGWGGAAMVLQDSKKQENVI